MWLLPCVLIICILLCLPVVILLMYRLRRDRQHPATNTAIDKLTCSPYICPGGEFEEECVICAEQYVENEPVIYLNCGNQHIFHETCIKNWLKINAVCPMCRKPIE